MELKERTFNPNRMKRSTIYSLLATILLTASTLTACQNDTITDLDENVTTGRIVLSLQDVEVFTEVANRATGNPADFTYTLNGTDVDNNTVTNQPVTFTDGSAIVVAGTYTLTATSTTAQDAAPWYQGTSAEFTVGIGEAQPVTINLGAPKNAAIAVTFDASFTALYENYSVTITPITTDGSNASSVTVPDGNPSGSNTIYTMPGNITYTIHGSAKQNSHVTDIPEKGITGTLTVAAGTSYPLNITAQTITDQMIGFGQGEHTGEFDSNKR